MTVPSGDRGVGRYVRRTVYPYSAHYRAVLDATGVGRRVRGRGDLARIPPTDLRLIGDPGALVLRPDLGRIVRHGRPALAAWGVAARGAGGMHRFSRHVERRFKPILWVLAEGVPVGYSSADVAHLARRGAAWLQRAGVTRGDVVVSLLAPGPAVAYWQLVLGCRRAGISAIHLDPTAEPAMIERLAPSVLVGEAGHLSAVLGAARHGGHPLPSLRTVLAVGAPLGGDRRARLRELAGGAAVVGAWAPAGVRAIWSECRAGADQTVPAGYHAWDDDVLDVAGPTEERAAPGELLWTGVGWGGSALLRLRTFAFAGVLPGRCPACGARGAVVVPHAPVGRGDPTTLPVAAWPPVPVASPEVVASVDALVPVAVAAPPVPQPIGGAGVVVAPVTAVRPPVEDVFAAENEVAAWLVEYRSVGGIGETIVTLAPAWGAAVVPLIRRLDRHLRATQFVVLPEGEVVARLQASGGRRVLGVPTA